MFHVCYAGFVQSFLNRSTLEFVYSVFIDDENNPQNWISVVDDEGRESSYSFIQPAKFMNFDRKWNVFLSRDFLAAKINFQESIFLHF